jgi:hypothetical protein
MSLYNYQKVQKRRYLEFVNVCAPGALSINHIPIAECGRSGS